ncbi:MAG TPA: glucoamylase family protein [Opitutaceae bacterium]|nr:glucoamylase family protein [Opitutaceae bacterium]
MTRSKISARLLGTLQRETFNYFVHEVNPRNGLVADRTKAGAPASIAAVGLALSSYPVGVERGFMRRAAAVARTLATLRFFAGSEQGTAPDATGHRGFYYHFLEMGTGRRTWQSELSTVDTAFLLAGGLTAAAYFDADTADERAIRELADELYRRADWNWACNGGAALTHGWRPGRGFLRYRWQGYDEALFMYVLGLGSPTHPLPASSYRQWASSYVWKEIYDTGFVYAGPLFTHQISHLWIDFRGIQDAYMRRRKLDYFENSRRATCVQRQYAIENPRGFTDYGATCWGITATDGPGPETRTIHGRKRRFFGYKARGVPDGPDDGSIAPWAVIASLPFAPDLVLPALHHFETLKLRENNPYGFKATFNPTYGQRSSRSKPWVSPYHYGINQGPIVMMMENFRSGLLWKLIRGCPYFTTGLQRAGFDGGWLSASAAGKKRRSAAMARDR